MLHNPQNMPVGVAGPSQEHGSRAAYIGGVVIFVFLGIAISYSPLVILASVVGATVLLIFAVRVDYFIMFMALYTPLEAFVLKWVPLTFYLPARFAGEALMLAMFFIVLYRNLLVSGRLWRSTPIDPPVVLLLAVVFFSAVFNDVPAKIAVMGMKNLLRYIFLFYIVVNYDFPDGFWKKLVLALLAMGFLEGALGVAQYMLKGPFLEFFAPPDVVLDGVPLWQSRLVEGKSLGTLGRYNLLGNFLNVVMCMGLGLYYAAQGGRKTAYWLFFAFALAGVVVSFSRMSWAGIYLAFIFILLILKKKRVIIYTFTPVVLTLALLVASHGTNWFRGETTKASPVERYVSIFSKGYIEKAKRYDRLFALFVTAPTLVEKYPLFGLGPGTFASEVSGGGTTSRGLYPEYSHQDWLEIRKSEALQYTSDQGWTSILCQIGLSGLFCVAWIFWLLFRYSHKVFMRAKDPFAKGMALGFLGLIALVIFQNFVSFNLTYRPVSLYLWMFAGYIVAQSMADARGPADEKSG